MHTTTHRRKSETSASSPVRTSICQVNTSPQQRRRSSAAFSLSPSPTSSPRVSRRAEGSGPDRFIPARRSGSLDLDVGHHKLLPVVGSRSKRTLKENAPHVRTQRGDNHNNASVDTTPAREEYKAMLERTLLGSEGCIASRVLSFSPPSPSSPSPASPLHHRLLHAERETALMSGPSSAASVSPPSRRGRPVRRLPSSAERVLDAPDILDDYYCVRREGREGPLWPSASHNSLGQD